MIPTPRYRQPVWQSRTAPAPRAVSGRLASWIAVALFQACLPALHSEDWPRFLGPRGDGTSGETNLISAFPPEGPRLLWQRPVGTGYGAPSVVGTRLVLHHREGDQEVVECLHAATGASLWRYAYPSRFVDPYGYNNGPRSTPHLSLNRREVGNTFRSAGWGDLPVAHGVAELDSPAHRQARKPALQGSRAQGLSNPGRVYTFGAEGRLVCTELESGRLVWERDTAKEWNVPEAFFGVGSSPLLEDDRLFVMVGGQPNAGVVALEAATGRTLWQSVGEKSWSGQPMHGWAGNRTVTWKSWDKQASYASPVMATMHGRRTLFCLTRQGLVALEPSTGEVLCSRWFRAQPEESVNAANPVIHGDRILISAAYYRVGSVLLRLGADRRHFDEEWTGTALEAHWSTPILHEGYLYGFSGRNEPDARFRCVAFMTGRIAWDRDESWRTRGSKRPDVFGRGSGILADGKLIVLGEGGLLGLFRPTPNEPVELARWQVPDFEYPCWTAPVLADGRLYLRSERSLVCVSLR